jgi:cytidine deaminase
VTSIGGVDVADVNGFPEVHRVPELFAAALEVQRNAYAPYSHFPVGAAILTPSGRIHVGCNVENAAYPVGSCAEAGAIAAMVAAGDTEIAVLLTICDSTDVGTCCGGCRQRVREFAALDTPIYACGPSGVRAVFTMEGLLPTSFGPDNLNGFVS